MRSLTRADAAEGYLKNALELLKAAAKHAPGIEAHKTLMMASLSSLSRKRVGAADAQTEVIVVE